jgi:phi13 family phage major tail protein
MADNKVIFGLKNVHYSVISEDETTGDLVYATPVPLKGAVEISLDPRGETSDFYADDILYYTTSTNAGYEATLTVAAISRGFRTDVLGETLDGTDSVLEENTNAKVNKIAFLFEFDGDVKAARHCLYNCTVTRPSMTSATKTETAEPQPQELNLVAAPTEAGVVKRSTTSDTTAAVYDSWYDTVFEPSTTA